MVLWLVSYQILISSFYHFKPILEWNTCDNCTVPYLVACPYDFKDIFPVSVSLTSNPCDEATNNLEIIDNQPPNGVKKKFGLCTKMLVFQKREQGVRIIEWVHMLRILGVDKVHIQIRNIHPDLVQILDYLQFKKLLEWNYYGDPSGTADTKLRTRQHRLLQMNIMNDCFYRVKNLYEFVAIFDPDEVIMPVKDGDKTWEDMFKHLPVHDFDTFAVQNAYFPHQKLPPYDGIPTHNYMLQHVQKSVETLKTGDGMKSFYNTDRVLVVHNHYGMRCLFSKRDYCRNKHIPVNISQVYHYRDEVEKKFNVTVLDTKIWQYKDELIRKVQQSLDEIGFKP